MADLAEEAGREVASELSGRFVRLDVGDPLGWAAAVSYAELELGGFDVAFLNAGVTTGEGDVTRVTDAQYGRM